MKSIKRFINNNPSITFTTVVTMIVGLLCGYKILFIRDGYIWELIFAICASIVAAFIFYVIQVYVPEQKKAASIKPLIERRLFSIYNTMNNGIETLGKLYVPNHTEGKYSETECRQIQYLNLDDKVGVTKFNALSSPIELTTKDTKFSVREWMLNSVLKTEEEIDKVYSYYGEHLIIDVDITLESILQSDYHRIAKFFCRGKVPVGFSQSDSFIYDYQELAYDLKQLINNI